MAKKINEVLNNPLSFSVCSCSLWSVIFLRVSCVHVYCTLLAPQILHRPLFSDPLGRTVYSQKDRKTIPYAKFAGQTECIMGDSKIVSGKEVCTHPSHLVLIILLYGAMEVFWPRTFESSGVENTPYVRACIRKTAIISFEFSWSFPSAKSAPSIWQSAPSASRSLSKCRLHGFKVETSNSVHYLTNFRSTLLVTSRISCYEVAVPGSQKVEPPRK